MLASFLFTATVCGNICSLVRLRIRNSSVAPCGCVIAETSQGLRGMATKTVHLYSRPDHQYVVSIVVTPQGSADGMCCAGEDMVVDA